MNTPHTNTEEIYVDTVAQDFRTALFIVSLFANLVVFTAWLMLTVVG